MLLVDRTLAQKLIKDALDERGDRLENVVNGLSAAVDRLGERQDKAMADLVVALTVALKRQSIVSSTE